MISMDGASLFSSLFARQNVATRLAPPEPAEGDRSGSLSQTAANSDQTATAAALEYRRVERTTLQIRTQEGDVVKLKFRAKDSLSGQSATVENGETTLAELSVRARSTTRLKISVQGDLNSDELAAIRSIVEQAGALANEFYSGGTAEAATLANSLELNPEQLDQVRFRFSLRERLTYTQIGSSPVSQSAPVIQSPPTVNDAADPSSAADATAPLTGTTEPSAPVTASTADAVPPDVETTDVATPATQPLFADVLSAFDLIATFLTDLLDALSEIPEPSEVSEAPDDSSGAALRYDVSFKLRVFQSILVSVSDAAGDEQDDAVPPIIDEALDTLAAQQQPALAVVA